MTRRSYGCPDTSVTVGITVLFRYNSIEISAENIAISAYYESFTAVLYVIVM